MDTNDPEADVIEPADGTRLRRIPTDQDGNPIGPYDVKIGVANLGSPPIVRRVPELRVVAVYCDPSDGTPRRAVVGYPALRVLPMGDGIDIGGHGHFRLVSASHAEGEDAHDKRSGEALFEVVLERD